MFLVKIFLEEKDIISINKHCKIIGVMLFKFVVFFIIIMSNIIVTNKNKITKAPT